MKSRKFYFNFLLIISGLIITQLLFFFFSFVSSFKGKWIFYSSQALSMKSESRVLKNPEEDWKRVRERFCEYRFHLDDEEFVARFAKRKTSPIDRMIDCAKPMRKKKVLIFTHVNEPKRIDEAMETWMFVHEENIRSGLYEYLNIQIDIIGWGSEKNHNIVEKVCPFAMTEMIGKLSCIIRYIEDEKSDYDFYLRLDDDTYLFITEFAYLLSTLHISTNSSQPFVMGMVWKGFQPSGGGGILFNNATKKIWNSLLQDPPKCPLCVWDDFIMGHMLQLEGMNEDTFYEYLGEFSDIISHFITLLNCTYNFLCALCINLGILWSHPFDWMVNIAGYHPKHISLELLDFHYQFPEPLTFHYAKTPEIADQSTQCTHRRYHASQPIDNESGVIIVENFYEQEVLLTEKYQKWKEECIQTSFDMKIRLSFVEYNSSTYHVLMNEKNATSTLDIRGMDEFIDSFDSLRSSSHPFEAEHAKMIHYMLYMGGWILHYNPHTSESCRNRLQEIQEAMESVEGSEFVYKLVDDDDLSSRISFIGGTRCNLSAFWLLAEIITNMKRGKPNIPFATAVLDHKKPLQFQKRIRKL